MVSAEFEKAAEQANQFTKRPTDDELLLVTTPSPTVYKQATVGDVNTERPGMFDLKGKYKWNKWNEQKGKSQEEAEKEYIAFVEKLKEKYA